ncbi:MAG TPA: ABC transporter permease [Balneolales bacterium]|nr:ABC transporter permease [Balneolales bacterium]
MKFEWYLAKRYFRGKRKESRFLSFIKAMAITGVAIGAGGLLIALSIVHGFKSTIKEKILGFAPHITVQKYADEPIFRADTLQTYLLKIPGVENVQAAITGQGMIQTRNEIQGTFIKGIGPKGDITSIKNYIIKGTFDLRPDSSGLPGVVMGSKLARELNAHIGSVLTAYAMQGLPSPVNLPDIKQFRLAGIYQTGIDKFDDVQVLMDRKYARKLFEYDTTEANVMQIRVSDINDIRNVTKAIQDKSIFPYYAASIYETYNSIFAWVNLQEQTIPFVISVMIIVAAFNLIGTILMMVLERTKDIGILKTMGADNKDIQRIFLFEGFFVAVVGLLVGIGLAVLFNWLQGTYHLIPLSQQNYYMSYAPVEPHLPDFFVVSFFTLLLCSLASYIPARVAARTNPLNVISFGR